MNFLAHDVVLPAAADRLERVATTLPDVWALLPQRPLPLTVVRALQGSDAPAASAVLRGIQAHMRADAVFHRHELFVERSQFVTSRLRELAPALRHASLVAHVLVEMLIDRHLMLQDPQSLDRYYANFDEETIAQVSRLGVTEEAQRQSLQALLERFVSSRFLDEYADSAGLVRRLERSLRRALPLKDPFPADTIRDQVQPLSDEMAEGWGRLLSDVRQGVAAWETKG